jgi:uncharacterized membrane protein YfcA
MQITIGKILTITVLTFIAGFVDSIAGGGGLISLPSYLLVGLPSHAALGTNKFSSAVGTFTATVRFVKNRQIHVRSAVIAALAALAGSFCGARLALSFDEKFLKWMLIILLPLIALFILTRKNFGEENRVSSIPIKKLVVLAAIIGFVIGAYDGFFGPGTGSFLILGFTGILGLDLATASGNTKIVNLASNIAAVATFLSSGAVVLALGIPAAIGGMLGNWLGSGLAIKNGAKIIRPMFIVVLALLFGKVLWDLLRV